MRRITTIVALLAVAAGVAYADWVVKATAGNPAVVSVAGGVIDKASSAPATPWTPTYAIRFNATNNLQYVDTGLYFQKNWSLNCLIKIRTNSVAGLTGYYTSASDFNFFGTAVGAYYRWYARYGNGSPAYGANGDVPSITEWLFCQVAITNLSLYVSTNRAVVVTATATTVLTNTTKKLYFGIVNGAPSRLYWDVARLQLIDPNGTVAQDLIATDSGTFTNCIGGATFTFGAGGAGGTSADSTNVTGQTFPTMNWAAGGGQQ